MSGGTYPSVPAFATRQIWMSYDIQRQDPLAATEDGVKSEYTEC